MEFVEQILGSGEADLKKVVFSRFFFCDDMKNLLNKQSKFTANSSSDEKYISCVIPSVKYRYSIVKRKIHSRTPTWVNNI